MNVERGLGKVKLLFSRNKNVICHRSNINGHCMSSCRHMHRSSPIYDRKSPFGAPRNVNVVCHNCNKFSHRNNECRRKLFQPYGSPSTFSFNRNTRHNHYRQHERVGRSGVRQRHAWNKIRNAPRRSRNLFVPSTGHRGMVWKGRSSQFDRYPSTSLVGKNIVCNYCKKNWPHCKVL